MVNATKHLILPLGWRLIVPHLSKGRHMILAFCEVQCGVVNELVTSRIILSEENV